MNPIIPPSEPTPPGPPRPHERPAASSAPIPSLDLLGDRLEAAAVRRIEGAGSPSGARRRSALAGGRTPWRFAFVPVLGAFAALVVALVVIVGGGTSQEPAAAAMVAAAQRSSALPTSRFILEVESQAGTTRSTVSLTGAYDEDAGMLQAETDLSSLLGGIGGAIGGTGGASGDATRLEVIIDRDLGYLRSPILATMTGSPSPWFRVDAAELDDLLGGSGGGVSSAPAVPGVPTDPGAPSLPGAVTPGLPLATDPSAMLELLRYSGADVENLGSERVLGVEATHYRPMVPLEQAMSRLGPEDRDNVRSLLGALGGGVSTSNAPFDVWIDTAGLVRRITVSAGSGQDATAASTATSTVTVDYLEPGAPVNIVVPTDVSDTDLAPLLRGGLARILGG